MLKVLTRIKALQIWVVKFLEIPEKNWSKKAVGQ